MRRSRRDKKRPALSVLLALIDVTTIGLTLGNNHGPVRFVLGLAMGLFIPGWSVVGLLKLKNAPLEFSLSAGTSLALLTIAAQFLMTIHAWHLGGLEVATGLVCLPSLLFQSRSLLPSKRS
jgi:uncharacterized membrane protein YfcA